MRTALLPFLFIFNTERLLIQVDLPHRILIFVIATVAMLLFAAASQGFFLVKSRIYESVLLLPIAFALFWPDFGRDQVIAEFEDLPPVQLATAVEQAPVGSELRLRILGVDEIGQPREFATTPVVPEGADGEEPLRKTGLELLIQGGEVIIDNVAFGSIAQAAKLGFDQEILRVRASSDRPPKEIMFIPALLLLTGVVFLQRLRHPRASAVQPV